jgi:hypothetical protein
MKLIKDLLEMPEREDGKFSPMATGSMGHPIHRFIAQNAPGHVSGKISMQIYPRSHELSPGRNTNPDALGAVTLVFKRFADGAGDRVPILYENIDEVIEALKYAKSQLEQDKS